MRSSRTGAALSIVAALGLLASGCSPEDDPHRTDPGGGGGQAGGGGSSGGGGGGGSAGADPGGAGGGGASGSAPTPLPTTCERPSLPGALIIDRDRPLEIAQFAARGSIVESRPIASWEAPTALQDANHLVVFQGGGATLDIYLRIDDEALRPDLAGLMDLSICCGDLEPGGDLGLSFRYGSDLRWEYLRTGTAGVGLGTELVLERDRPLCLEDDTCPLLGSAVRASYLRGKPVVAAPGSVVRLEGGGRGGWLQVAGFLERGVVGCPGLLDRENGFVFAETGPIGPPGACSGGDPSSCGESSICEVPGTTCGVAGAMGSCVPRPLGCGGGEPVCGCDGEVHRSACDAELAGIELADAGGCEPPPGFFACGTGFCRLGTEYCERVAGDGAEPERIGCRILTSGCRDGATGCACAAVEPCAGSCSELAPGALFLDCPPPDLPASGRDPLCDAWTVPPAEPPREDGAVRVGLLGHSELGYSASDRHLVYLQAGRPAYLRELSTGREREVRVFRGGIATQVAVSGNRAVFDVSRYDGGDEFSSLVVLELDSCRYEELRLQPVGLPGSRRYGLTLDGSRLLFSESSGTEDQPLVLLDLATGEERVLTDPGESGGAASIAGDLVVFQSSRGGPRWTTELLDLGDGSRRTVSTDAEAARTDGRTVALVGPADAQGYNDVLAHDVATGITTVVASGPADRGAAYVRGDDFLFRERAGLDWTLKRVDLPTLTESVLVTGRAGKQAPCIAGDQVLWNDYGIPASVYGVQLP